MGRVPFTAEQIGTPALVLDVKEVGLTREQFFQLCRDNSDFFLELSAQKELIIMSPPGANTSRRNAIIIQRLGNWAEKDRTGVVFDCACHFDLPNGAIRSPDAAWVKREHWDAFRDKDKEEGFPICPEFVVELMSPSSRLKTVKRKMEEFIANGSQLGWLIDPYNKMVYVYRPSMPAETLENPTAVIGDPILPGFVFNVAEIW